jgi:hypothetical protein
VPADTVEKSSHDTELETEITNEMARVGPRQGNRKFPYDESLDESAKLIAEEPVEIEAEVPAEENQSVERIEGAIVLDHPCLMSNNYKCSRSKSSHERPNAARPSPR